MAWNWNNEHAREVPTAGGILKGMTVAYWCRVLSDGEIELLHKLQSEGDTNGND